MFCTNGVLLRMLTQGEGLDDITHVIVDEIHERDRFADFLLILLRDVLPAHPKLRVVLMSATLHIELFSNYFGKCPVIEVCPLVTPHKGQSFFSTHRLFSTPFQHSSCSILAHMIEVFFDISRPLRPGL